MKERKISRRAVCSAMVASLALGVLEGCGSSSSTTASSAAGSGAAASNERITVRILKSKAANEVAAEQMDVWKVLGEKFNMDFEFDNPPQDNYNERLNLVMMDAQLPDIIMDMPTTEVLKYGESGVILSLNDYIENNMPNLKKEIDKRDGVEKALTYSDGNIYYMPMLDEKVSGNMPYIVRTDWLEKLGIESPVTLEDWENYWHLVKTTDLNGNSTNDEIPFSSYNMDGLRNFCTAFGCLDDFYTDPDDGGKVHYGPIDPKYKKAVTWMHDMYEKVLKDASIWKGYLNTILYTVLGTLISVTLTACAAYPLSRKDLFGRNIFISLFIFTMFFNGGMIPTYLIIQKLGMLNKIWALVLPSAISTYNMIIMRTFFENTIPNELIEAAALDGCNDITTFFRIVLPLSGAVFAVMALFYGVAQWNSWFPALLYIRDRSLYPLQMILREVLIQSDIGNMAGSTGDVEVIGDGLKYATMVVSTLPIMCLYPFLQKYFVAGVTIGAVKG